jgi:hypothetical protein
MVTGPAQRPGSTQAASGTATASASEAAAASEPEPMSAGPLPEQGPWIAICSLIYQERSSLSSLFTVRPGTLRLRGSGIEYMAHISSMCIHRERSSIGRARASHARGTGIETRRFHMFCSCAEFCVFFHIIIQNPRFFTLFLLENSELFKNARFSAGHTLNEGKSHKKVQFPSPQSTF